MSYFDHFSNWKHVFLLLKRLMLMCFVAMRLCRQQGPGDPLGEQAEQAGAGLQGAW